MGGGVLAYCNTFLHYGTVHRVLQITKNELCRKHRNHKKTIIFMITKKIFVYCCAFNHSFAQNIFFLTTIKYCFYSKHFSEGLCFVVWPGVDYKMKTLSFLCLLASDNYWVFGLGLQSWVLGLCLVDTPWIPT